MAEAKDPGATYQRKTKDQISIDHKLMCANYKIDMGRINKIVTVLSHGPCIMQKLNSLCNGGNRQEFKNLVERIIDQGLINKQVNGHVLYYITEEGKRYVKDLRKQIKVLFSAQLH